MRPLTSWSALTSAKVGIWGLGVEGTASLHRLRSMGIEPVLVDDHPHLGARRAARSRESHGVVESHRGTGHRDGRVGRPPRL